MAEWPLHLPVQEGQLYNALWIQTAGVHHQQRWVWDPAEYKGKTMVLTIVSFLLLLGALMFFHELGHYLAARRNGIEVEEFGVFGFPPASSNSSPTKARFSPSMPFLWVRLYA